MENEPLNRHTDFDQLNKRIAELEKRIVRLEKESIPQEERGFIKYARTTESEDVPPLQPSTGKNESIESRFGEYGMAWLGNIVLLFGILFLTQFLQKNGQEAFSVLLGLISVAGIYVAGRYSKKALPYMSRLFTYNGHIMLFILSMRIYLFQGSRMIENAWVGHGVVLLVVVALIFLAFRNKSQVLAILVWIMAIIAALYSNSTHLMLLITVGVTGSSIFFASRYGWWVGLIFSICLIYFSFLVWIMGNPFLSGSIQIISHHQFGYIYLFVCAISYSLLAMLPKLEPVPTRFLTAGIILNGIGFSIIFILAVLAFFTDDYFLYFGLIAAFCMGYSILLQARGTWKIVAAIYAIYSFVSLSISIAGIYNFPLAFFLLSIQSLLVISMALWFRSRFIVIMNTILFIGLLIAYLATADSLIMINFSFAVVALVTARVMNWKKKRLELRTELIRNIYLFIGSIMILYSLHHAVPAQFVTLSWTLTALLFFVLSIWIKNIKYRWLAIITMVITVFYLFIVDLKSISLGYRIVALLFLSIISLGISVFYNKRLKSKEGDPD